MAPGSSSRAEDVAERLLASTERACAGTLPTFGPPSLSDHVAAARQEGLWFVDDLLGAQAGDAVAGDRKSWRCQRILLRAAQRCLQARFRTFTSCKRRGLLAGTILDAHTLGEECLGGDGGSSEAERLVGACFDGIEERADEDCHRKGESLASLFPGCGTDSPAEFASCVRDRSRCRFCRMADLVDGLAPDCDAFDDGADNASCAMPALCGDGRVDGAESCDDGATVPGDGCDSLCRTTPGYECAGEPSVCTAVCGDGVLEGEEACDDGNGAGGDGCSGLCLVEIGYACGGEPSLCSTTCGDGIPAGDEACDDGNLVPGDGCDHGCRTEPGHSCVGAPSVCSNDCGNGAVDASEECDDGGTEPSDGCSPTCREEPGYACAGEPSVCEPVCGDGRIAGGESCDDGGVEDGDGCDASCAIEPGHSCTGQPSLCTSVCGDGLVSADEECDDGNAGAGDGCDACTLEFGFTCSQEPSLCVRFGVAITSPAHGSFLEADSVVVEGEVTELVSARAALTINEAPVAVASDGTFSVEVPISAEAVYNPIVARLADGTSDPAAYDRIVVVRGVPIAHDAPRPAGMSVRIPEASTQRQKGHFDETLRVDFPFSTLLPEGTVLADDVCVIDGPGGCEGRGTVRVVTPGATETSDAVLDFAADELHVSRSLGLQVALALEGTGAVPGCGIVATSGTLTFERDFAMEPAADDPAALSIAPIAPLTMSGGVFSGVPDDPACEAPDVAAFFATVLADLGALVGDLYATTYGDADGPGPARDPWSLTLEEAFAGLSLDGPAGEDPGVAFDAPFASVVEDSTGVSVHYDTGARLDVGTGPGKCIPPLGAAAFANSLDFTGVPPALPDLSIDGQAYDVGIRVSVAVLNQLFRAQMECGLLAATVRDINFGSPEAPVLAPIDASMLATFLGGFGHVPESTPFRIELVPTLPPIVLPESGPQGEPLTVRYGNAIVRIIQDDGTEHVALAMAFDAVAGVELGFDKDGLLANVVLRSEDDITTALVANPLEFDESDLRANLESVLPVLLNIYYPNTERVLQSLPIPSVPGQNLDPVQVVPSGPHVFVFANTVEPTPF